MATVINNPAGGGHAHESDSGSWIVGLVLLVIVVLFLLYGLPLIRGGGVQQINNSVPAPQTQDAPDSESGINVQVPDKVDVNVNPQGQQQ